MKIFSTASELTTALAAERAANRTIGFVPTMGALHAGHAALVRHSAAEQAVTVASIFVNPTQFNDGQDLAAYPRTPDADIQLLREYGCHYLYLPTVDDVYPAGLQDNPVAHLDFGRLTTRMEGASRPGHFAGVVQVVSRLLDIVRPHVLYMGQKDYQQVAVVRRMVDLLGLQVSVTGVPTVREADGLAMSSRNRRLNVEERRAAAKINRHLSAVAAGLRSHWPARELERLAIKGMQAVPLLEPEYVEVVDGDTLLPYQDGEPVRELVVATAVRVGAVRLIDNRIAITANP
ncbi:pantoate--beta-alanine ligase [Neolewinella litorea]|uniref:Pantothenate synthetase n=1 Tax=Neolewinella litorea TaxID=2562452 RepID=A0A4S4NTZ0_9BACT|nr:pantoate--beta-alanine ligase [Neolewinella litorea]THH41938.1 pantoate--beta-alanine ligase [Neolewinella litorea]